jgi:hypothetical protein
VADLSWSDLQFPAPAVVGETAWGDTELLAIGLSGSNDKAEVVTVRSHGISHRGETVTSFVPSFMVHGARAGSDRGCRAMRDERSRDRHSHLSRRRSDEGRTRP